MISCGMKQNLTGSSWIRTMFEEGSKLKKIYGDANVFDFSLGNPDPEPPQAVIESFIKNAASAKKGTHSYMSNAGYPELREKIALQNALRSGLDFKAENAVITCGAAGGLNVALKTILDPGDQVIVLRPYFAEYIFYIKNSSGSPVFADTDPGTFQPDPEQIEKAITKKTKAIILNSPNNPTGAVYKENILRSIAVIIKEKERIFGTNIIILSDEPYRELVYDGAKVPDIFDIFDEAVVIYSYSKSLSIPGERIGYILSSPKMANASEFNEGAVFCNRTLGFVNAPAFIQRVLLDTLDIKVDPCIYKERRDILYTALSEMGFECIKPEGAFYLFPRSPIADEVEFIKSALKYNLLLVPGRGFGMENHFRIAYCIDKKTISDSLPQFKKLAQEYGMD
jgi:aspartate aminotransferase